MYWYHWNFFGMHFFWWMFWSFLLVTLFTWAIPVPRAKLRLYREDPLSILQRRLAAGDVTAEQYEQIKARLMRDLEDPKLRGAFPGRHIDRPV